MMKLAVIGGSGLKALPYLDEPGVHELQTPYGKPSSSVLEGLLGGKRVYFLARHGQGRHLPPHAVNYRANIAALAQLGVSHLVTVNIVGGITPAMMPGCWVVPDQLIDYTWGREHSFYDENARETRHIEFASPFDPGLMALLAESASAREIDVLAGATYACTQGPRLETAAEIARLERDGCDIVGMTAMPEAALARERGLAYASLCLVVNWAAGKQAEPISMAEIEAVVERHMSEVPVLIADLLQRLQLRGT